VAERGVDVASVVRACRIAREVTAAEPSWDPIERLSGAERAAQAELMSGVDAMVETVTRWYTMEPADPGELSLDALIAADRQGFERFAAVLPSLGDEERMRRREETARRLVDAGVPEEIARAHALRGDLAHAPAVIRAAEATGRSIEDAAQVFSGLGRALRLDWLERELDRVRSTTRMQRWALQAVREDAFSAHRSVTEHALRAGDGVAPDDAIERYLAERQEPVRRLETLLRALSREGDPDLAGLTLAVRGVRALAA
jgi:glutamate dehydrogenase